MAIAAAVPSRLGVSPLGPGSELTVNCRAIFNGSFGIKPRPARYSKIRCARYFEGPEFFFEFQTKHSHYARSLYGDGHIPPLHCVLNLK